MFVVDEKFAETICAKAWHCAGKGYLCSGGGKEPRLYMHRLIWELEHGSRPEQIDHINRIRWDNRLENLRPASEFLQKANQNDRPRLVHLLPAGVHLRSNGSGRPLVSRPYESYCIYRGKKHHFGYFSTPEAAAVPYREFKAKIVQKEVIDGKQI